MKDILDPSSVGFRPHHGLLLSISYATSVVQVPWTAEFSHPHLKFGILLFRTEGYPNSCLDIFIQSKRQPKLYISVIFCAAKYEKSGSNFCNSGQNPIGEAPTALKKKKKEFWLWLWYRELWLWYSSSIHFLV